MALSARLRKVANPIEWFAWLYGKFFLGHPYRGVVVIAIVWAAFGLVLWARGVDKYKEDHKPTVAITQEKPVDSGPGKKDAVDTQKKDEEPTSPARHIKKISLAPVPTEKPMTQEEALVLINTLAQQYRDEHPGPVQISIPDMIQWINGELETQGKAFRVHAGPRPTVLNNVNIQGFGSTQMSVPEGAVVIMKNGSVTGGKVGIENNAGQIYLDGTQVSNNEKNIVNNAEPKKKEPEVKPPPPPHL
jgi:hypothetical protein